MYSIHEWYGMYMADKHTYFCAWSMYCHKTYNLFYDSSILPSDTTVDIDSIVKYNPLPTKKIIKQPS
jgi:hypothetical protein